MTLIMLHFLKIFQSFTKVFSILKQKYFLWVEWKCKEEKINNFKKIDIENTKKIAGGFAISAFISTLISTIIPAGISIISSLVGLGKSVSSPKGEIKTKDLNYKWDNSSDNSSINSAFSYCI